MRATECIPAGYDDENGALPHAERRLIFRTSTHRKDSIFSIPSKGDHMNTATRATAHTTREERGMTDFRLLINGKLVEGAGTLDVINPATGRVLTAAPRAGRAQLDEAVAAAKAAFPGWSATPLRHRAALLVKLAEALAADQG